MTAYFQTGALQRDTGWPPGGGHPVAPTDLPRAA
jgi:hypothetical protein